MKKVKACLVSLFLLLSVAKSQEIINLYSGPIPNSKPSSKTEVKGGFIRNVTVPTLEKYLPEASKATGAAVIIFPGGGYSGLAYDGEGVRTAKELANRGIATFVVKYRLPDDSIMIDKTIGPLQDAQQAIKVVRENAAKWGIDSARVGIMGFSAGGHLVSTAATHFKKALIENNNNTNLRPAFLIAIYPVISMQENLTHRGSRNALLGQKPSKELVDYYSNELQVDSTTPPTYITHTGDDRTVDVDNSILFYEALRKNKVPAEMHLYPKGDHGFVLRWKPEDWIDTIVKWMRTNKWVQ
jgi:acetyl esterase/lipase